jgi:hydroxyacylglutathione hydrolase
MPAHEKITDRVARFELGPFATNCYVLRAPGGSPKCWIIDAGFDPDALIDYVTGEGLTPELILLTHAHADHIAGLEDVRERFPDAPVAIHGDEVAWLDDPEKNLSQGFGMPLRCRPPERTIADDESLELDGERWSVLHTPGHSPGGVTVYNAEAGLAFAGDTLFHNSIGRFDFPTSNGEQLFASIKRRLYTLPDETVVLPGHGPKTTIGNEKRTNPFVRPE